MAALRGAGFFARAARGFWLVYLLAAAGTLTWSDQMQQQYQNNYNKDIT
jgi:hypothetical protein